MYFMEQNSSSNIPRNSMNSYENYCDATLCTEDGLSFKIHRILLAQKSEYFRSLFNFEANNRTTDILIKEIGSQTLRKILHYVYKGYVQLDEKNVLDLMIAADCMRLDDLKEDCRDFAIRCMTTSNCLALLTTASRCKNLNNLREFSRYVKVHFEEIVKGFPEEIGNLPIEVLKELLNDNALNVTSEDTVRMAIVNWIKTDPFNRNRHLPNLINYIRFEETYYASKMVQDSVVISTPFSMEPLQGTHPIIELSFLPENLNKETRLPKYLHVGGHKYESETDWLEADYFTLIYLTSDEELDFWRIIVADLEWYREVIGPIGKYIYLISDHKKVRYDVLADQMISLAAMSMNRYSYYIVELHGMIYALGGFFVPNAESVPQKTNAIERYDPFTDTWNLIEPVGTMSISAAVALNGKVHVLGHIEDGLEYDMMTRVYDPMINVWTTVKSPRVQRTSFAAVAFQNRLYLIGGSYEDQNLRSVEEYDPILDEWSFLPSLPVPYDRAHAKVLDGVIMVFEDKHHPRVRWDSGRRSWQKIESVFSIYSYGIMDDPNLVGELVKKSRSSTFEWKKNFSIKIYD